MYIVSNKKNWPCTSEMQDPLSKQLRKRNATIAASACDNPPSLESLGTKNIPFCSRHPRVLYVLGVTMLRTHYTTLGFDTQASMLSRHSETLSHYLSNFTASLIACQDGQAKAVQG